MAYLILWILFVPRYAHSAFWINHRLIPHKSDRAFGFLICIAFYPIKQISPAFGARLLLLSGWSVRTASPMHRGALSGCANCLLNLKFA
jgi:hypothetical protein